MMIMKNIPAHK